MRYFQNIYDAVRTIAAGLRITLPYFFARGVVVQYPEVAPVLQPRFRGFHRYEIERCIACEACAKICPVDCIALGKSGPRKIDKARDIAVGGAVSEYKIDHGICLFCGLCVEVCPTGCLKMGSIHDNSCYCRADLITDYIALAKAGRRTIEPIWLTKTPLPPWAARARDYWRDLDPDRRELMAGADDPGYCGRLAQKPTTPTENSQ
ncbi:MAG: NADH-quinone oxidoreductase subunit I [Desulfobacterales bacterium]|nr:NADH-quinone oxidoreductase subunit I [Desulfobacterales bacterium]